jgi:hypothetical protein
MPQVTFGTFSLAVETGWTLSTIILSGPQDDQEFNAGLLAPKVARQFRRNVVATMEQVEPQETPESYVKRQIDGLAQAGVIRQEVRDPEEVQLQGGLAGLLCEHIIVGASGERVRQLQLIAIKQGIAHTIIASHLDGAPFEAARQELRDMLLSFAQ